MKNEIEAMITDITATTAEAEDYTGEDGLLYCGKCHTPKEAYFSKETAQWLGHDRHPAECDCQRAAREKQQAAESRQKHLEKVEDLKRRGFTDPAMRNWTFEHDNGRNPQTETARFYVESWETMQAENIGYLFWGGVGTGKSYLAACIANALMEKEVAVCMTNFATIEVSFKPYSRASHAAASRSRPCCAIYRTTACLLSIFPFQLCKAASMSSCVTLYHLVSALRCGADDGGVEDAHLHDAVDGLLHELVVRHLEGVVLEGTNL